MKVLAGEGAPHGILVNGMLVGLIDSDQHVRRHQREGINAPYDDFAREDGRTYRGTHRQGGGVRGDGVLPVRDLAGFTTGTAINMDGGASPVV